MPTQLSRRSALASIPASLACASLIRAEATPAAPPLSTVHPEFPSHHPDLAREIVGASHARFDRVKQLLEKQPALARAAWDWGFGDWETALGAASHTGRRDIAQLLIAHGARPDIFTLAMLGNLPAVRACVEADPSIASIPGPHGISLLNHARAGGEQAKQVFEYLQTIDGADRQQTSLTISDDEKQSLIGEYAFSPAPRDRFIVKLDRRSRLAIQRPDRPHRLLHRIDTGFIFAPAGAEAVRIIFAMQNESAAALTIHDPDPIITATRL